MFQLSTTVWENIKFKNNIYEDEEKTLKNVATKKIFIDKLLNNLTLTLQTTTRNIYTDYMNKLQTYKQQLHDFTTNNTRTQDTTHTEDELLTIITNI